MPFRLVSLLLATALFSQARIKQIIIDRVESPTFTAQAFGDVGRYEKIIGRAIGEVDPFHPANAVITDIGLIPRNGEMHVRYETQFYLLKPVDTKRGNGLLVYSAPNRGDKRLFNSLNQGLSSRFRAYRRQRGLCFPVETKHEPGGLFYFYIRGHQGCLLSRNYFSNYVIFKGGEFSKRL